MTLHCGKSRQCDNPLKELRGICGARILLLKVISTVAEPWEHTDLRQLVGQRECAASDCILEVIHKRFEAHPHDFMAVIEDGRVIGVCSHHGA